MGKNNTKDLQLISSTPNQNTLIFWSFFYTSVHATDSSVATRYPPPHEKRKKRNPLCWGFFYFFVVHLYYSSDSPSLISSVSCMTCIYFQMSSFLDLCLYDLISVGYKIINEPSSDNIHLNPYIKSLYFILYIMKICNFNTCLSVE